jgi:hypothetical protein
MKSMNHKPVSADTRVLAVGTGQLELAIAQQTLTSAAGVTLSRRPPHRLAAAPFGVRTEAAGPRDPADAARPAGTAGGEFPGRSA